MEKRVRLSRTESQAQTRERLLQSARQLLARHGYGGVSVDMIAAEAGYSKGAVYSNFATKEMIIFELLERHAEQETSEFRRIMQLDPAARRGAIGKWLDNMHADADWDVVTVELQLYARRNPDFARRFYSLEERLTDFHAEIIAERFQAAGRVPPVDPKTLSIAFRTLACGLSLKAPQNARGPDREPGRIIRQIFDVMLDPAAEASA